MKTHFNFRIGTKKEVFPEGFNSPREPGQLFSIIECHYKDDIPSGYSDTNLLSNWDNLEDLKGTYEFIKTAWAKPILDLDNWPKEFKQ